MKWFLLSLCILFSGCAVPAQQAGYWDKDNRSKEPYLFTYSGAKIESMNICKRFLIENGFSIATSDEASGAIITDPKMLAKDETLYAGAASIGMALAGNSVNENGIVTMLFDSISDSTTQISLKCSIDESYSSSSSAFGRRTTKEQYVIAQGDPLPMKMKFLLLKNPKFTLK